MANKPKLNETRAGVTIRYSHADKGYWIEENGSKYFVKKKHQAIRVFNERVAYSFRVGLRVV